MVSGLEGSALSALIASRLIAGTGSVLAVMEDVKKAEGLFEDLSSWIGEENVCLFPSIDLKPYEWRSPFGQIIEQRLQCFSMLLKGDKCAVVTTADAFLLKLPAPDFIRREILKIEKGQEIDLEDLRTSLVHMGFYEEGLVEEMGHFSVRGGIIDIYPFLTEGPIRMELWGNEIESIREFDIFTQRSTVDLQSVEIFPFHEFCFSRSELEDGLLSAGSRFPHAFETECSRLIETGDRTGLYWQIPIFTENSYSLLDFIPDCGLVVWESAEALEARAARVRHGMEQAYSDSLERGFMVSSPGELLFSVRDLIGFARRFPEIRLSAVSADTGYSRVFQCDRQTSGGGNLASVHDVFLDYAKSGYQVLLLSPNQGQAERLLRLTENFPVTDIVVGRLSCGFVLHDDRIAIFTDHQIFNRFSRSHALKKYYGRGVTVPDFDALERNDLVVHQDYGVGRFIGVKRVKVEQHAQDCILLQYKGNDRLTIPVSDLNKIQKYASREGAQPALSRLGGRAWDQLKQKTRSSIIKLAQELIELYAKRSSIRGIAYSPDNEIQAQFENEFLYRPTPDQLSAAHDIKCDMMKPHPMDRLVCGDVGFGKTEVAMRAAFKAVLDKKQVAVLAPTTVLVSQHYESFCDRFSNWPVSIEYVNRFKSKNQEKEVLARVREGKVDIIIGTHRLISSDVEFRDLGLIIIDEEQKFGVMQKERLKTMRTEVDVLSMSATPIPRTLHMSMVGARDLSVIMTPPRNRLPIDTRVVQFDEELVRAAMERELERGGQCFFVHNRVEDLPEQTLAVEALVPSARVGMAHGQMHERDLEQVMLAFIRREYDILVTTSIIESGLDLPNVNTIIINKAQMFGVSQLFQLRGRVGRSSIQAYCLLIAPPEDKFSDEAKRRLFSLQKFTELGSGYQLAMRDLEIRGAGNILGYKQSGHINALGFDTYCTLLKQAVQELQTGGEVPELDTQIEFPVNAFVPEDYVEDGLQRIGIYQKVARCSETGELDDLEHELRDRFGPVPYPAAALIQVMKTRIICRKLGFSRAALENSALQLYFPEGSMPGPEALSLMVSRFSRPVRVVNEQPLRIVVDLEKQEIEKQILQGLSELVRLV